MSKHKTGLEVGSLYYSTVSLFLYSSQDKAEEAAVRNGGGVAQFYFIAMTASILLAKQTFLILKVGRKVFNRTPSLVLTTDKKIGWANLLEVNPI